MGNAKIMYTNIRSVPKKVDELLTDLGASMNEIDFCCFTETRLNSDLIQMYNIEHCRGNFNCRIRKGGGVAIYTKKEYTVIVMDELSLSQSFIESLFVKTKISSFNIVVGCIHRPPGEVFDQFMVSISDVLMKLKKYNNHNIVIGGDFNINLINNESCFKKQLYLETMFANGYMPLILRSTRVSHQSATLIDHIWCNNIDKIGQNGIIQTHVSDHFPVFSTLKLSQEKYYDQSPYVEISRRQMKQETKDSLMNDLTSCNWEFLSESNTVTEMYNSFSNRIELLFNSNYPVTTVRIKKLYHEKSYISHDIKLLIKEKHRLQRLFVKKPITYDREFRAIRNTVNKIIRKAKDSYYRCKIKNANEQNNTKETWNILNHLMGRGKTNSLPDEMEINGSMESITLMNIFVHWGTNWLLTCLKIMN